MSAAKSGVATPRLRRMLHGVVTNRRVLRYSLVAMNVLILASILLFAVQSTHQDPLTQHAALGGSTQLATEPLDQLSSADIAANAALVTALPETTAVINQADSVAADLTVAPADTVVVAKPQSVVTALKSAKDIKTYVVVDGDTVSSIAAKFSVTSDSIMWSNNLSGNTVSAGTKLLIPPVSGIVYTVKDGDTVDSLASKYRASRDQIVESNDTELSGLKVGQLVLIPNGQQPAPVVYRVALPTVAVYGYNGYDYGFCTWYVANRRNQAGSPLPANLGNASTWDSRAASEGLSVGKTPAVGAAVVTSHSGAGHVAYVEQVNDDGSIWVTEMNSYGQVSMTNSAGHGGWGVVDWKLISADRAASFNYIY